MWRKTQEMTLDTCCRKMDEPSSSVWKNWIDMNDKCGGTLRHEIDNEASHTLDKCEWWCVEHVIEHKWMRFIIRNSCNSHIDMLL